MTKLSGWRRFAAVLSAGFALLLAAGCETTPAFQVSQPASREGTVESIVQDTVQSGNAAVGTIGGSKVITGSKLEKNEGTIRLSVPSRVMPGTMRPSAA